MPTPMRVFAEIAARYGFKTDDESVDVFFCDWVPKLSKEEQRKIFNELLERECED